MFFNFSTNGSKMEGGAPILGRWSVVREAHLRPNSFPLGRHLVGRQRPHCGQKEISWGNAGLQDLSLMQFLKARLGNMGSVISPVDLLCGLYDKTKGSFRQRAIARSRVLRSR